MTALPGLDGARLRDLAPLQRGKLARVLAALDGDGEETRLVGGAVRDLALGAEAGDFDLATTATPEETTRRAEAAGFKAIPTGLTHGTVTIVVDGKPFETTTLRQDVETDGRHAKVAFGRDFAADARRRDFTINALSLGRDGTVHDTVGGLADLAARRVRFIGDADERIREDYLRILRFFRFSARFSDGRLDRDGLAAALRGRHGLEQLSRERVRAELMKLLLAPHAGGVVGAMGACGLLEPTLGGLAQPARLRRVIAIEAARGAPPDALLRLAALAVTIPENAERLHDKLRLANAERERLAGAGAALIGLHGINAPPSLGDLRALLFSAGRVAARDALTLAHAESQAPADDSRFLHADRFLADTPAPRLPLRGADIVARGLAQGPRVGELLRVFQARWIRAGFPKEPETLARLLEEAMQEDEG